MEERNRGLFCIKGHLVAGERDVLINQMRVREGERKYNNLLDGLKHAK